MKINLNDMKKQTFKVKVKYVFSGYYTVKAYNKETARNAVRQQCGLVMGGSIHSTLNNEDVDWNFDLHPDTVIGQTCPQ